MKINFRITEELESPWKRIAKHILSESPSLIVAFALKRAAEDLDVVQEVVRTEQVKSTNKELSDNVASIKVELSDNATGEDKYKGWILLEASKDWETGIDYKIIKSPVYPFQKITLKEGDEFYESF